jgi:NAD+ diphosphatase
VSTPYAFCPRCATPLVPRALHASEVATRLTCPAPGCGFVFYDNPLPVAAAVVEHEGGILLVHDHAWPEGWFGLVTGFIERGESAHDAILRELREELGLVGEIARLIGVYPFPPRNELIVAFHVRAEGVVTLGAELAAWKWIAPEKLRAWPFGTGLAVRDWLASRGGETPAH